METLGFVGAALLAMCALPQAIKSYRDGVTYGLSTTFLWTWYVGEIIMLYYVYTTISDEGPLFCNYLFNTLLLTVILYYKYFPRGDNGQTS